MKDNRESNSDRQAQSLSRLTRLDATLAGLLALLSLALYVRTLAPSLLWGDSAELQTLSYTLGMTHPTGYPIYLLFGKLFTLLPFGNIAYRVNLFSAVAAALVLVQLYCISRLLGGWRVAALAGALLLAFTPIFWVHANIAELYTPAVCMVAALVLLLLLWRRSGNWRYLFLAGLVGGLSLGVHNTVALAAPAVLVYLLLMAHRRANWLGAIGGALAGLILVGIAFLALDALDPPSSYYHSVARPSLSTWGLTEGDFDSALERMAFIFAARQFRNFFFDVPSAEVWQRLGEYISFPLLSVLMILLGCLRFFVSKDKGRAAGWREGLLFLVIFLVIVGFAVTYRVYDYRVFYLPSLLITALWYGMGISSLLDGMAYFLRLKPGLLARRSSVFAGLCGLLLVSVILLPERRTVVSAWRDGYAPFMQDWEIYPVRMPELAHRQAEQLVSQLEDDAIVFTDWGMLYPLYYVAHVEQGRTGMAFHETYPQEGTGRIAVSAVAYIEASLDQRPVYFTQPAPEMTRQYRFLPVTQHLYQVQRK